MSTSRKQSEPKKRGAISRSKPAQKVAEKAKHTLSLKDHIREIYHTWMQVVKNFMARRPHRTLRLSRRRDYARKLIKPGFIQFTGQINSILRAHWKLFTLFVLAYAAILIATGAVTNQENYKTISDLMNDATSGVDVGGFGVVGKATLVALASFAAGGTSITAEQGTFLGLVLVFAWLATVWLLREIVAGRNPKLRDGLYNSGAPIISTLGILFVGILQLLPIGITAIIYNALSSVGLISDGFGSMLFWVFAAVVVTLVLYWMTSTVIALVIVTNVGMYPLRALRLSGDIVLGRRTQIFLRIVWGLGITVIMWGIITIGAVLLDRYLRDTFTALAGFSVVPYIVAVVSAVSVIWFASYTYLLYRKIIENDTEL